VKKKIIIIPIIFLLSTLVGCNVKIIEKIEPTVTPTLAPSEIFGDITIFPATPTPIPEDSRFKTDVTEIYNGMLFYIQLIPQSYALVSDGFAKIYPDEYSKDYLEFKQGDMATLKGVSEDTQWAWISLFGEVASFVKLEMLDINLEDEENPDLTGTPQKPTPPQQITPTIEPTPTTYPTLELTPTPEIEPTPDIQPTPEIPPTITPEIELTPNVEPTQPPIQEITPIPTVPPEESIIRFPDNPQSTFFNLGVEFAEIDIILTVTESNVLISSGPDDVSEYTGYEAVASVNKGNLVQCIGIGRNGWVKVIHNGRTGYINGKYLK